MTTALDDPAARAYLRTLNRLLEGTPDRNLVVDGIAQHIQDSLAGEPADPARVRAVLEDLGDPAAIAAEAATSTPPARAPFLQQRSGANLIVLLLTVGGVVVPVAGWIVGLGLLWFSKGWTTLDKTIATFGPALLAAILAGLSLLPPGTTPNIHLAVLIGLPVGALAVAVYLLRRFRERA
jgi:hypothetical protein